MKILKKEPGNGNDNYCYHYRMQSTYMPNSALTFYLLRLTHLVLTTIL